MKRDENKVDIRTHKNLAQELYLSVWRRCSCHWMPSGRTGHDHQYHGFNQGAPGKVITLFGPQGTLHRSLRSKPNKNVIWWEIRTLAFKFCWNIRVVNTYNSKKHPFDSLEEVYMIHQALYHLKEDETWVDRVNQESSFQWTLGPRHQGYFSRPPVHESCHWILLLMAAI